MIHQWHVMTPVIGVQRLPLRDEFTAQVVIRLVTERIKMGIESQTSGYYQVDNDDSLQDTNPLIFMTSLL